MEDYRSGDVKDFYQKWNKLTKDNGVFESWVDAYNFESKALTAKALKPIQEEDSSLIFNQFLEILYIFLGKLVNVIPHRYNPKYQREQIPLPRRGAREAGGVVRFF
mgnify:CR=1 FL=1